MQFRLTRETINLEYMPSSLATLPIRKRTMVGKGLTGQLLGQIRTFSDYTSNVPPLPWHVALVPNHTLVMLQVSVLYFVGIISRNSIWHQNK
jgi:hypothetical protein